jgi:Ca2+-binding EF-hand superfamily protein
MGSCACTRVESSPEERIIQYEEHKLNFEEVSLHKCIYIFNKYTVRDFLPQEHLAKALKKLELPLTSPNADDCIEEFYTSIRLNGEVPRRLLVVTAVLLCKGTVYEKTEVLYDFYDFDSNQSISTSAIAQLLEDLYQVACIGLPRMVTHRAGSDSETVSNYLSMINAVRKPVILGLTHALVQTDRIITKKQFLARMMSLPCSKLVTSSSLRSLFLDEFDGLGASSKAKVLASPRR